MNFQARANVAVPQPYTGFDGLPIGGEWQKGKVRSLTALDAATGKQKWSYTASKPVIGGVAASGGDLLFAGELSGDFRVFDGRDGKILSTLNAVGPSPADLSATRPRGISVWPSFRVLSGSTTRLPTDLGGSNPTITVFALKRDCSAISAVGRRRAPVSRRLLTSRACHHRLRARSETCRALDSQLAKARVGSRLQQA